MRRDYARIAKTDSTTREPVIMPENAGPRRYDGQKAALEHVLSYHDPLGKALCPGGPHIIGPEHFEDARAG